MSEFWQKTQRRLHQLKKIGPEPEGRGDAVHSRGGRVRNLALAAAATALSLLLLEGATRLLLDPPRYHGGPVEFHPELGFRGVPGHRHETVDDLGTFPFELNSQGLRGREVPAEPVPGVFRVAFVGDSFLVGQAVREEHLMTSLAAAALQEHGLEAEVYNLSGIDYGTGQEILLLRGLGKRLEPDAVVLFLYPANDVINNSLALAGRSGVSAGDYVRPYLVPEQGVLRIRYAYPFRAWLRRHSRLYATLERRLLALGAERGIAWLKPWSPSAGASERLRWGRAPREDFEIFRRRHDPGDRWEEAWRTTFALLRAFRDECEALGARLLVVVIPSVYQVERTAKGIALDIVTRIASGQRLDRLLDWNLPERRLAGFFEEEDVEARFLLAVLRDAAALDPPVYTRDEHLGPRGHEIAARAVVDWLIDEAGEREFGKISGEPVRVLPDSADGHSLLDFREQRHAAYLGDGWISWTPEEAGIPGGWLPGPRALLVLPIRAGDFVVRGWVPSEARLPIDGHVEIVGGSPRAFRLEQEGPFEIRFPWSPPLSIVESSADGYLAAFFVGGERQRVGKIRAGLMLQQIGFETPSGDIGEPD
jgi:hypothetical protein